MHKCYLFYIHRKFHFFHFITNFCWSTVIYVLIKNILIQRIGFFFHLKSQFNIQYGLQSWAHSIISVFTLIGFFITAPFQSFDDWCKLSIENCFVAKQFETIIEELTLERAWSWFKINNLKILFSIWCLQSSKLHVLLLFQMVSHNLRVNRQIMCRALNSLLDTGNLRAWGLNKKSLH